jgi:hypothetical protein
MIDCKKVEDSAAVFVSFFIDLNLADGDDRPTFIENLLGFIYAFKLILKGAEVSGIMDSQQIDKICEELAIAVEENISKEKVQKLFNVMKGFVVEEKNVRSNE